MTAEYEIRPAQVTDLGVVTRWLDGAGLPADDLTVAHMESFLLVVEAGEPVGMARRPTARQVQHDVDGSYHQGGPSEVGQTQ